MQIDLAKVANAVLLVYQRNSPPFEQHLKNLFNNHKWMVTRGPAHLTNYVLWNELYAMIDGVASSAVASVFESELIAKFHNYGWLVYDGCRVTYATPAQTPAPAPASIPYLGNTAPLPPTPAKDNFQQRTGNMLLLNRMTGDFQSTEIAIALDSICYVLPYGPSIGGKACGCRIKTADGEWHNIRESYGDVLALLPEGM